MEKILEFGAINGCKTEYLHGGFPRKSAHIGCSG